MAKAQVEKTKSPALPVVLVVDDDLAYLEKLQRALRDIYTVYTTTSGVASGRLAA